MALSCSQAYAVFFFDQTRECAAIFNSFPKAKLSPDEKAAGFGELSQEFGFYASVASLCASPSQLDAELKLPLSDIALWLSMRAKHQAAETKLRLLQTKKT